MLCLQIFFRLLFFDHLVMECGKALLGNSQCLVILSDFNSDPAVSDSPQGRFLQSFMGQFHLHELVQCPTRVRDTTSKCMDLILTNSPSHQATNAILCGSSDHHYAPHSFLCSCLMVFLSFLTVRLFSFANIMNLMLNCYINFYLMISNFCS